MKNKITIFTDGASKGNPGKGGFGIVISYNSNVIEIGGHKDRTTNNEMELKAVVEALKVVANKDCPVEIFTDSKYVVEGAKGWIFSWIKNGWKTKSNSDVLNKELWQELLLLLSKVKIIWHKVPGHVGIIGNERADTIASNFAENGHTTLYNGPLKKYDLNIGDTSYDEEKALERTIAKNRTKRKAFSYVSRVDGVTKIHKTWNECEAQVKGKKGIKFKKSLDKNDELEIIKDFEGK